MFDQLPLLDVDPPDDPLMPDTVASTTGVLQGYLLFFALLPPPALARDASVLIADLLRKHALSKPAMPAERLHVTLLPVAGFGDTLTAHDQLVLRAATAAGATAACRALQIVFNRAGSMAHKSPAAYVLRCDAASDLAIAQLRKLLLIGLRRNGLPQDAARLAPPHMTMVYGTQHVAEHPVAPLAWAATRLSLVLSHHGLGHHQRIADWALR